MDWDKAKPLLDAKLDIAHVRKPTGPYGPKGDYIEGWHAIAEANRIFGHGGWSYVVKVLTQDALSKADGKDQWQAAYTCIVTVTVSGVTREDVGFGSGFANRIGDAIEGATKESVTDALKRALRTFGNQFGLALYDKTRVNVETAAPPASPIADMDTFALACATAVQSLQSADTMGKARAIFTELPPAVKRDASVTSARHAAKERLGTIAVPGAFAS